MAPVVTSAKDPSAAAMTESSAPYTRLHITPFDPSFQNLIIPASVLPRARNISYHTLETFPEKPFGFIDLPTMDADKLKKKLNGAVLKGTKIRVETARPESIPDPTADAGADVDADIPKAKKEKKLSKKRKHEGDGVIEGVQLEGRKVKRGWTTTEKEMIEGKRKKARKEKNEEKPKDEKKSKKKEKRTSVKSKYSDEPECLFKTKLPGANPSKETDEGDSTHKKKQKRKSDCEVTVHEFEKTVKYPTFLKSTTNAGSTKPITTTFEDGVGWVDVTGKVVEPVKTKRRPEGIPAPDFSKPKAAIPEPQEDDVEDDETSSSGSSSSDEDEDPSSSESESNVSVEQTDTVAQAEQVRVRTQPLSSPSATKSESARPKSSGSFTNLSIKIPPATPATKRVHPLEALYKRPQGEDSTTNHDAEAQPFSFFGNGDENEEDDTLAPASQAPMTPFTKQEFEFRNVRSAAPTPDTAHPSRSFHFWASQGSADNAGLDGAETDGLEDVEEEEGDDDADMEDGLAVAGEPSQTPASDFQKQFWESRGDLNRAWRKRRKSAAKDKRYRDNRARAERAI
jgi:hypothetical protein